MAKLLVFQSVNIESNGIAELLNEMREISNKKSNVLNFDSDDAITDEVYARLTGIIKDQFNIVHKSLSSLRSTSSRCTSTALTMLLVKLRTGFSLAVLSTLFGVKKITCSITIYLTRVSLISNFVPKYLGLSHKKKK